MDWTQVLVGAVVLVGVVIGLGIKFGFGKLAGVIESHVDNEKFKGILLRLNEYVEAIVLELNQTTVAALKKAKKFDAAAAKAVKADAIKKIKELLGEAGVEDTLAILGIENEALEALLSSLVEKYIFKSKG